MNRLRPIAPTLPWAVVFVVPAAFQLLYGLNDVGLVEEWGFQLRFDQVGPVFWTPLDDPGLAAHSIRPLSSAAQALAFLIDPDSFAWYHLVNAAALGLKGVAMLLLLGRLGIRRSIGVTGAVVFALFPAWTGLFAFRMVHAQFALAGLVFAVAQYLAFADRRTVRRGVLMTLSLALGLLFYEIGYVAVLLAPALLLVPSCISLERFAWATALWFCVPLLNGVRVLWLFSSDQTLYERELLTTTSRAPLTEFVNLVRRVFQKGFGGFVDPPFGIALSAAAIVLLVASLGAVLYSALPKSEALHSDTDEGSRRNWSIGEIAAAEASIGDEPADEQDSVSSPTPRTSTTDRRLFVMTVGALAAAPIVALIYSPHPAHLADPMRIFAIACLPLTVAIVGALEILARHRNSFALAVSVLLVVLTASSATAQRDHLHRASAFQEAVLGAIGTAWDSAPGPATGIVVIDPAHLVGDDIYTFLPETFQQALLYLLPDVETVLLCHAPFEELAAAAASPADCVLQNGAIVNNFGSVPVASSAVIEIRLSGTGPEWSGDRRPNGSRILSVLPCAAAGTCGSGPFGVHARFVAT